MGKLSTHSKLSLVLLAISSLLVLTLAAWLRFDGLADRPLHFDEGTNARILATRLYDGTYEFDPQHFHGPLLSLIAAPVVRSLGQDSWETLTKFGLRLTAAACGLLAVAGALGLGRVCKHSDGLVASLFLATSPLLVYYSRMMIHEPLFAVSGLIGLIALKAFLQRPNIFHAVELGLGIGLMAATRETFVISLMAWGVSAIIWMFATHPDDSFIELVKRIWTTYVGLLLLAAAIVAVIILAGYSTFGRHPTGIIDFFRSYLVYDTISGHDKPPLYYLELLLWPKKLAGVWWTEAGIMLFALYGYFRCPRDEARTRIARFLVHSGLIHLLVYSAIAYKTPWLACMAWVHFCLAAAIGAVQLYREVGRWWRIPIVAAIAAVLFWQGIQTRHATGRLASDGRNPYAYVPTSNDAERMAAWLHILREKHPALDSQPVAVVGSFYWPLPWYLRGFSKVGYWNELPGDAVERPLILILPTAGDIGSYVLDESHELFPRGLRHEFPVIVAIRRDIWEAEEVDSLL